MDLTLIELLEGTLSLIYVLIVFKLGTKILSKFFKEKLTDSRDWTFLYFGVFFILMSSLYWPVTLSFVSYVLFDSTIEPILFFSVYLIPLGLTQLSWMLVLHSFKLLKREFLYWVFYLITSILFEAVLIYFLCSDLTVIGIFSEFDRFYFQAGVFVGIILIFSLLHYSVTHFILFRALIKSHDIKVKWRAKFYLSGFILLMASQSLGYAISLLRSYYLTPFSYSLIIMSAFSYYFAFYLPEWLSKWISKRTKEFTQDIEEVDDRLAEFMKTFVRPQVLTVEEVMFYKEKKICLVCKAKTLNFIYVCSKCEALYCEKCARNLENLDNACWVCDQPFNSFKPSKPFKRGETEETKVLNDKGKKDSKVS